MTLQIPYSEYWDKLKCPVGTRFTTIRDRYSKYGDKMDYYKTGSIYQQVIKKRPAFTAILNGIENWKGSQIPDWLLEKDTMLNGVPQAGWIKKIKEMPQVLILTQTKLTEDTSPV